MVVTFENALGLALSALEDEQNGGNAVEEIVDAFANPKNEETTKQIQSYWAMQNELTRSLLYRTIELPIARKYLEKIYKMNA